MVERLHRLREWPLAGSRGALAVRSESSCELADVATVVLPRGSGGVPGGPPREVAAGGSRGVRGGLWRSCLRWRALAPSPRGTMSGVFSDPRQPQAPILACSGGLPAELGREISEEGKERKGREGKEGKGRGARNSSRRESALECKRGGAHRLSRNSFFFAARGPLRNARNVDRRRPVSQTASHSPTSHSSPWLW